LFHRKFNASGRSLSTRSQIILIVKWGWTYSQQDMARSRDLNFFEKV